MDCLLDAYKRKDVKGINEKSMRLGVEQSELKDMKRKHKMFIPSYRRRILKLYQAQDNLARGVTRIDSLIGEAKTCHNIKVKFFEDGSNLDKSQLTQVATMSSRGKKRSEANQIEVKLSEDNEDSKSILNEGNKEILGKITLNEESHLSSLFDSSDSIRQSYPDYDHKKNKKLFSRFLTNHNLTLKNKRDIKDRSKIPEEIKRSAKRYIKDAMNSNSQLTL
jgi:hypothetical protein